MKPNYIIKVLALIAALWLGSLLPSSRAVQAQSVPSPGTLYIEPGVQTLRAPNGSRQVLGKVFIDLTTGNVWGFPTTTDQPYPVDVTNSTPPTSHPFLLGKYDLAGMSQH